MTLWRACLAAILTMFLGFGAAAQGLFNGGMPASLTYHSGWSEPDGKRITGIRIEMERGWKTYWRSPGDSGIPPEFDWTGSENLADVRVAWPAPVAFDTAGSRTFGYKDRVVIPLALTPEDPSKPIRVQLALFYGLCEEICIPAREDFAMEIAPDAGIDGGVFIRNALAATPAPAQSAGLVAASCSVTGAGDEREFEARLTFEPPLLAAPIIIAEGPKGVWFGHIDAQSDGADITANGPVRIPAGAWIDRAAVNLTILPDSGPALYLNGCVTTG